MKANFNYYFPSFKVPDGTTVTANTNSGFGAGFYFRYDFTEHVSFQPELILSHRSGSFREEGVSMPDTAITITTSSLSNTSQIAIELPLYFKARWEIIPIRKGAYKWDKAIGVLAGPRLVFSGVSSVEQSTSEVTRLYNQESAVVTTGTSASGSEYFAPMSFGLAVGVDFELINRLSVHVMYYRGLTSMTQKTLSYKSFDNRVEAGIGIRLY